jgi:peptidoglycan hydrolase-like protein with peptidoglycan-binding domain/N-acetylmuramoyl-L-alanine amidase CwlA
MRRRLIKFASVSLILLLSFSIASANVYAATKPILREGMKSSAVKNLQSTLKKLGYFSPALTGYFGSATVSAVKKFQKKHDIPVTGVVATLTYNKINALLKPAVPKNATAKSIQSKNIQKPEGLKIRSTGKDVSKLQNNLKLLGYMKVSPTGDFGPITEGALIQFQKNYKLDPNGVASPATLSVIERLSGQRGSSSRGDVNRGEENKSSTDTQVVHEPLYPVKLKWISGLPQVPFLKGVGKYEGVVIHFTDNMRDTAQIEADYQKLHWRKAFVHEFIDPNEVIQVSNPDYKSWGAGEKANDRFIHLELCHADTQSDFDASFSRITQRAAEYLYRLQLGVSPAKADGTGTLWGHMDVSRYLGGTDHTDPVAYLSSWGISWDDVISSVTEKYNFLLSGEDTDARETSEKSNNPGETSIESSDTEETSIENTTGANSVESNNTGETTKENTDMEKQLTEKPMIENPQE